MCSCCHRKVGAAASLGWGLQRCRGGLKLQAPRELSLHPAIRFQHLLALHRGKVLRICPSKPCPCPLRSSSFSKECKQTPESSFSPLCYQPGSCVPLCLGSLACFVVFSSPQTTSSSCNPISLVCPSCVLAPGSCRGSWGALGECVAGEHRALCLGWRGRRMLLLLLLVTGGCHSEALLGSVQLLCLPVLQLSLCCSLPDNGRSPGQWDRRVPPEGV